MNPFAARGDDPRDTDADPYAAAACKGMFDLYEAAGASQGTKADTTAVRYATRAALNVCNGDNQHPPCPILNLCLLDTLTRERDDLNAIWSVRGGLTERERHDLRRTARRKATT